MADGDEACARSNDLLLYHEKQTSRLCGVHALNSLFQAPVVTEEDMLKEGIALDEEERQVMGGGSLEEGSGNVSNDGNFNIQVLFRALHKHNLRAVPASAPEGAQALWEPVNESAFLINMGEHWFTIRRIGNTWYDFNSQKPAPEEIQPLHLEAYLAQLQNDGYTVFVVRGGSLPQRQNGDGDVIGAAEGGQWLTASEAKQLAEEAEAARVRGRSQAIKEELFERAQMQGDGALRLSASGEGGNAKQDSDADLQAAIQASLSGPGGVQTSLSNDPDLDAAIQESLRQQ